MVDRSPNTTGKPPRATASTRAAGGPASHSKIKSPGDKPPPNPGAALLQSISTPRHDDLDRGSYPQARRRSSHQVVRSAPAENRSSSAGSGIGAVRGTA